MQAAVHALAVAVALTTLCTGAGEGDALPSERQLQAQLRCPVPTYRAGQVTPTSASPTCTPCAELLPPSGRECQVDAADCAEVETGGSCQVRCRLPYEGNATTAVCPSGNSNPARQLLYELPDCSCPEPPGQQGYSKTPHGSSRRRLHFEGSGGPTPGEWECAPGYAGQPHIECEGIGACTESENQVRSWLAGCDPLVPCAAPVVDSCRYDVTACVGVRPGEECEIRCRPPFLGGSVRAACPASNTDPDQELIYYSLACRLEECPDPQPWPPGYNKTPAGTWTCATGYNGEAVNRCIPGPSWSQDCGAVSVLEGCRELVPCAAEELTGLDLCMYDTSGCQNVPPGGTCEVHCKAPFQGLSTEGNYCPEGNTNRRGLIWTKPQCSLVDCADPTMVGAGYMRTLQGWQCAESYSGYAAKVCESTEACEVVPKLTGCAQLMPCVAPAADCRFYTYGCASVQPGATCQISCKAPFTGGSTTATCLSGNTDPDGLVVASWPQCRTDTCADPWPWPLGYVKTISGWQCAPGFAGLAVKSCQWIEARCSSEPVLAGCVMEEPCRPLQLSTDEEICKYNVSQCSSVSAGTSCLVSCKVPYSGDPVPASCPAGNIDPTTQLEWSPPLCDCQDPWPLPPGYNRTEDGGWKCANGFAGRAMKVCRPRANCQPPEPDLTGCYVPVACEVAGFNREGSGQTVSGTVRFGPALIDGLIDEDQVEEYRIYFGDRCNQPLGEVIATVAKTTERKSCCRSDTYEANLSSRTAPPAAMGLLIVVHTSEGDAPAGRFLTIDTEPALVTQVLSALAPRPMLSAAALLGSLALHVLHALHAGWAAA